MFPLAPLTKGGVRALAAAEALPTQARRDSQGICFLGKVQRLWQISCFDKIPNVIPAPALPMQARRDS